MSLTNNDLILRRSVLTSDSVPAQNGGRMAYTQVVSGVKNNVFPDTSNAQRLAGITFWRKVFMHINVDSTDACNNLRMYFDRPSIADDYWLFQPATATGTQASDANEALLYGVGLLSNDVAAGVESVSVTCEHSDYAALLPFRVGMLVRISDIPPGSGAGNEEFRTLSAVSIIGSAATLTFTGAPLLNAYTANDTVVSGVIEVATLSGSFNSAVVTSAAGTLAHGAAGNLSVPGKGSISESWTLTFSSATTFSVSGAVTGALPGTGSISADYSANNASTLTAYFTILASAWGGTFVAGDTITFITTQASLPLLIRQRVPAGSGSQAGNSGSIAWSGESA